MAAEEPVKQDMQMHVRDYSGFTKLLKWGAIISFVTAIAVMFIIS